MMSTVSLFLTLSLLLALNIFHILQGMKNVCRYTLGILTRFYGSLFCFPLISHK